MSRAGAATASGRPHRRPVTVRLPETSVAQLRTLAASRGVSLSDLLGEAAALLSFDARLSSRCPALEQSDHAPGAPPGYA